MMGFILREPQSTPANFLDFVGEGWAAMGDGAVHANSFPKLLFRLGSRSKQLYRTATFQPASQPNFPFMSLGVMAATLTIPFS